MVRVTRLRKGPARIAGPTIEAIEGGKETRLHLTTGEDLIVKERPEDIVRQIVAERRERYHRLPPVHRRPAG